MRSAEDEELPERGDQEQRHDDDIGECDVSQAILRQPEPGVRHRLADRATRGDAEVHAHAARDGVGEQLEDEGHKVVSRTRTVSARGLLRGVHRAEAMAQDARRDAGRGAGGGSGAG